MFLARYARLIWFKPFIRNPIAGVSMQAQGLCPHNSGLLWHYVVANVVNGDVTWHLKKKKHLGGHHDPEIMFCYRCLNLK